MTEEELDKTYRKYLAAINAGHLDTMDDFVAEQCIFNGLKVNPEQYGEYVTSFMNRCEDGLHFKLVDLVIDAAKGRLVSKLVVSGTPITDFFGMRPTGHEVSFDEVCTAMLVSARWHNIEGLAEKLRSAGCFLHFPRWQNCTGVYRR